MIDMIMAAKNAVDHILLCRINRRRIAALPKNLFRAEMAACIVDQAGNEKNGLPQHLIRMVSCTG